MKAVVGCLKALGEALEADNSFMLHMQRESGALTDDGVLKVHVVFAIDIAFCVFVFMYGLCVFVCLIACAILQVQEVRTMNTKLEKLKDIIECMRCEDEERDVQKLHSAIDAGSANGLVPTSAVYQFEIAQIAKDHLDSGNIEQWAELLMKEAIPTASLPRRLSCLSSDMQLVHSTQEQLIFDALVAFSKTKDKKPVATLVRETLKHKSELEQNIVDEIEILVECIPMPTEQQIPAWSEQKLVLYKQKARSTGKLIRQFGFQPLGIDILAQMDTALAVKKRNKAFEDVLLRLKESLCNDSCAAWKASDSEADMIKFKGRVLKVKKELEAARKTMDEAAVRDHQATFEEIGSGVADAVSHLNKFANKAFNNAVGNAIVDLLDWKGAKPKGINTENRARLMKLHENVKEQLQAALKSFETWGLDDLASEGASFAETMLKITKITEALMWLVPLLAGEVLAGEAPSVEDYQASTMCSPFTRHLILLPFL